MFLENRSNFQKGHRDYSYRKSGLLSCSVAAAVLITGCSGGSSSSSPVGSNGPAVSSTSPANAATNVPKDSDVTATFNKDMFAVTVDDTSFFLDANGAVSGNVTFDAMSNVATFTPTNDLSILTEYTATVTDAVTDLDGTPLDSDYQWSFTTADGSWATPQGLETQIEEARRPQVGIADNGDAIAVWEQLSGSVYSIFANRYDGSTWGSRVFLESLAGNASNPDVAVDSNGNALAVWTQTDSGETNVYAARFNGTSWGSPTVIDRVTGMAFTPQIATDDSGTAIAVWRQSQGGTENIWANRFNGTSWGTAVSLEPFPGLAFKPKIAMDGSGNGIAVWHQDDGTPAYSIFASRFNGTNWTAPEEIDSVGPVDATSAAIAMDSSGIATVVWHQDDSTAINVWANRFDGSNWGTALKLENDETQNATEPDVAMGEDGTAIAIWLQEDAQNSVWATRFDGSNWEPAQALESVAGNAIDPRIAMDPLGRGIAIWAQSDNSPDFMFANRFDGTSWGAPETIGPQQASNYEPAIAMDTSGRAVAVWTENQGSNDNILANRFE